MRLGLHPRCLRFGPAEDRAREFPVPGLTHPPMNIPHVGKRVKDWYGVSFSGHTPSPLSYHPPPIRPSLLMTTLFSGNYFAAVGALIAVAAVGVTGSLLSTSNVLLAVF